jgi:hypothetical protein
MWALNVRFRLHGLSRRSVGLGDSNRRDVGVGNCLGCSGSLNDCLRCSDGLSNYLLVSDDLADLLSLKNCLLEVGIALLRVLDERTGLPHGADLRCHRFAVLIADSKLSERSM